MSAGVYTDRLIHSEKVSEPFFMSVPCTGTEKKQRSKSASGRLRWYRKSNGLKDAVQKSPKSLIDNKNKFFNHRHHGIYPMYKMPIIAMKKGRPESHPLSAFSN
jgi:hypothetical protein